MFRFEHFFDQDRYAFFLKNEEIDVEYAVTGYSDTYISTAKTNIPREQVINFESLVSALIDHPEMII